MTEILAKLAELLTEPRLFGSSRRQWGTHS